MKKIRVAAYCRYSSEAQKDGYSIKAQLNAIKSWCDKDGYEIVATYIDEARSGTNDVRENFQAMIADSSKGLFDAVVVHKLDRFARDRYDSAIYKKKLKDNGVKVFSVLERLDDSPESIIMEGLLEAMAEYYSANLAREVMKGKKEAAKKNKYLGGTIPIGFDIVDGKHAINPEEAEYVKFIFDKFNAGYNYSEIARYFNDHSLKFRTSAFVSPSHVKGILRNPIYKGTYVFGRNSEVMTTVVTEDAVPAIVSKELWDSTQSLIDSKEAKYRGRHISSEQRAEIYLLTGYVHCGECGSHFFGHRSGRSKKPGYYYRCSHRRAARDAIASHNYASLCHNKMVRKEMLESYTIAYIEKLITDHESLSFIADELNKKIAAYSSSVEGVDDVKKALDKLKVQQNKLLDLYLEEKLSKEQYEEKNKALLEKRTLFEKKLNSVNIVKLPKINATMLKELIGSIRSSSISGSKNKDYERKLISTFLHRIDVYSDHLEYTFNFPIGNDGSFTSKVSRDVCNVNYALTNLANLKSSICGLLDP